MIIGYTKVAIKLGNFFWLFWNKNCCGQGLVWWLREDTYVLKVVGSILSTIYLPCGHFSHILDVKIVMVVWKDENKWKRGRHGSFEKIAVVTFGGKFLTILATFCSNIRSLWTRNVSRIREKALEPTKINLFHKIEFFLTFGLKLWEQKRRRFRIRFVLILERRSFDSKVIY